MQIHQVERDPTLQIPLNPVDGDLLADVQDFTERNVGLCDRLIDAFVLFYPFPEIALGLFSRHAIIIWIAGLDLQRNVGSDNRWIVAVRFEEEEL